MNPNIIKDINHNYEIKKFKAISDLEERKKIIYTKIPKLKEIDDEINNIAIESMHSILLCEKEQQYSYVKNLENKIETLNNEKKELLKNNDISPSELEPIYECEKCKDTGFLDGKRCSCYEQQVLNYSYNNSNLKKFSNQTFDNFNFDLFSDDMLKNFNTSPKQNIKSIFNLSKNFVNNFDNQDQKNLFFCGETGLGKTYLSSCIANELLKKNKTVLYQTAPNLLDLIIDYKINNKNNNSSFYHSVFNVDLLIIDDLGAEYLNNFNSVELFNIINNRIIATKNIKTIISTNLDLNSFKNKYDARIVSRIIGNYTICRFLGDDVRLKLR